MPIAQELYQPVRQSPNSVELTATIDVRKDEIRKIFEVKISFIFAIQIQPVMQTLSSPILVRIIYKHFLDTDNFYMFILFLTAGSTNY